MEKQNINSDIYNNMLLRHYITLKPQYLTNKIDQHIENQLKNELEGKCIAEGYVEDSSIKMLNRSIGKIVGSRFDGSSTYEILYEGRICNPKKGDRIKCNIKFINRLGILAYRPPLTIIVPRSIQENPELFNQSKIDDEIEIEVLDKNYTLEDKEIRVIAVVPAFLNKKDNIAVTHSKAKPKKGGDSDYIKISDDIVSISEDNDNDPDPDNDQDNENDPDKDQDPDNEEDNNSNDEDFEYEEDIEDLETNNDEDEEEEQDEEGEEEEESEEESEEEEEEINE